MIRVKRDTDRCGARTGACGARVTCTHRRRRRIPAAPLAARVFVSLGRSRPLKRPTVDDWLAGVAMILAAASWGVLAVLLTG